MRRQDCKISAAAGMDEVDDDAENPPKVIYVMGSPQNMNTFSLLSESVVRVVYVSDENGVFGGSCSVEIVGELDCPTVWSRSSRGSNIKSAISQVAPDCQQLDKPVAMYPAHQRLRSGLVTRNVEYVKRRDIQTLVPGNELNDVVLSAYFTLLSARDELLAYKKWKSGISSNRRFRECAIFSVYFLKTAEVGRAVDSWSYIRGHVTCGCGKLFVGANDHE